MTSILKCCICQEPLIEINLSEPDICHLECTKHMQLTRNIHNNQMGYVVWSRISDLKIQLSSSNWNDRFDYSFFYGKNVYEQSIRQSEFLPLIIHSNGQIENPIIRFQALLAFV